MIDENIQDTAIAYVLGEVKGPEALHFLAAMDADPELQRFVSEMEATFGDLALSAPQARPSEALRARLFQQTRPSQKLVRVSFAPWALAAALAIACTLLAIERANLHSDLASLRQKSDADAAEVRRLAGLVEDYRKKSDLSEMKIATLNAQVQTYAEALAVVVWDSNQQQGLVKLSKLPKLPGGKDYQLWVLDPSYKQPVSAGVVSPNAEGAVRSVFKPVQQIHGAEHFAVSVEKSGGSSSPQGQIVLVGQ